MKDSTATPSMNLFLTWWLRSFMNSYENDDYLSWWNIMYIHSWIGIVWDSDNPMSRDIVSINVDKCILLEYYYFIRLRCHIQHCYELFALQKVTDSSWPCSFNNVCLIWLGGATLLVLFLPSWTLVWNLLFLTYQLHVIVYIIWIECHDHVFKAINSKVE